MAQRFRAPLGAAFALLLALVSRAPAAESVVWSLDKADARVVDAGMRRDTKTGAWSAEVVLRLVNRDLSRSFHGLVVVEFIDASGRNWPWKTFVELAPGSAQHRRINSPRRMDCAGPLSGCPGVKVRVSLKKGDPHAPVQAIPRLALDDPGAPPAGSPLYVASVEDGSVLRLLDGRRVRPLGLLNTPHQGGAAAAWARNQVMDAPVRLAYDTLGQDKAGRWQAYIELPDGRDLGGELLRRGFAQPDTGAEFSRKASYLALTTTAR